MSLDIDKLLRTKMCPRCGAPFKWLEKRRIGNRVYYYAVHELRIGGRRYIKKCYLGPETYTYVTKLHSREGLELRGLVDRSRVLEYLDAIIGYLQSVELEPVLALELAKRFEEIAKALRKAAGVEHGDQS